MIRLIDLRGKTKFSRNEILNILPRATQDITAVLPQVSDIILEVKNRGAAALYEHAEKFDGVANHDLKVHHEVIKTAYDEADTSLKNALEMMIERVQKGSAAQVPDNKLTTIIPEGIIEQRWLPVERVGLYVPGGKAVYPSSVVMNVVSAQAAGVQNIAIASPVQKDYKSVHPTILTAAYMLGISDIYAIGGASAVAAFAYGVPEISLEPVDVVTGPGNIFVAAAKRALQGTIGIDSEAGTTEILIIADKTAEAKNVAADLLSQAEHDEAAASILVTDSEKLVSDVQDLLASQVANTENSDRAKTALTGPQSAIILVDEISQATEISNVYAPEHLSIQTSAPEETLQKITNAGATFLGNFTPVSLGDYLAGSNHVLPTGGTAKFASGLGAHTFLRPQQIVKYSRTALKQSVENLTVLAQAEGLPAHAEAASIRFED